MPHKLSRQLTVKISERADEVLAEIRKKHRYEPTEIVRGLLDSLIIYWYQRRSFSFPVQIKDGYLIDDEINSQALGTPAPKGVIWSTDSELKPLTGERLAEMDKEFDEWKRKRGKPRSGSTKGAAV